MAEVALQQEQTARQALNESAQRAIDILESISDAFICVDRDWRIAILPNLLIQKH